MEIQQRFWQAYVDLVRDAYYANCYRSRTEATDWQISVFSALLSSASIAGWAIWRELAMLSGIVIALSQVIQVVRPYMPFRKRLVSLNKFAPELDALAIVAEGDWFFISRGEMTEVEIHTKLLQLRRKKLDIINSNFRDASLPENKAALEKAESLAKAFFLANFGVESAR
ncbi:hypothetical protein [Bosea sp. (in: a-proteobacteria)]|jgi:hypothetical protein|uniref:hypothetical protein n=1 Tax=Bosea sp. (in: a-proteobacteria) TaxID=1871050 RepID=UPI003F6F587B